MLRRIVIGSPIKEFRTFGKYHEAMAETWGDPELPLVFRTEVLADPPPESGRTPAQIHSDVKDFTDYHTNELALGLTNLIMQTAQDTSYRARMVVLIKKCLKTGLFLPLQLIKAFKKEPPLITENFRFYAEHLIDDLT